MSSFDKEKVRWVYLLDYSFIYLDPIGTSHISKSRLGKASILKQDF